MDDRVGEQAAQYAALRAAVEGLARSVADLAGRIAQTEDQVERVHEEIAQNGVSAVAALARVHAARARGFAEHERRERQRWLSEAERLRDQRP
jgi:hypothetical protein